MFRPDFIMIPTALSENKSIRPLDEKLYGYIYWFTKLKNEKCTASNQTLAELTRSTGPSIANCLTRLEKAGFIKRIFTVKNNDKVRKEIIPLVMFGVSSDDEGGSSGDEGGFISGLRGGSSGDEQSNNIYNNSNKEDIGISTKKVFDYYQSKIQTGCKWIESTRNKIKTRLGVYSEEELFKAIDLFSKDSWWMENNSSRGPTWFFNSDHRIEQFMGIKPRSGGEVTKGVYKDKKSGLKIPESVKV